MWNALRMSSELADGLAATEREDEQSFAEKLFLSCENVKNAVGQ